MSGRKGFITMVEMFIVAIALFVAFSLIFPGFHYKSKWDDTLFVVRNRDILTAADRAGQLQNYSYNATNLQEFVDIVTGGRSAYVTMAEAKGTFKSQLWIACNCSNDDLNQIITMFDGLKVNGRDINVNPCYTNLEKINPCLSSSDVLLIFGRYDLSNPKYLTLLKDYLRKGSGIVEVSDLDATAQSMDPVQTSIFGLGGPVGASQSGQSEYALFRTDVATPDRRPESANSIYYGPWKYFYNVPVPLQTTSGTIPMPPFDSYLTPVSCDALSVGNFSIQSSIKDIGGTLLSVPDRYRFWICDSDKVFFDNESDGSVDFILDVGDSFMIADYYDANIVWNFTISYIDGQNWTGVSFNRDYHFSEFSTFWTNQECICPSGTLGKCDNTVSGHGACRDSPKWSGADTNLIRPLGGNNARILLQTDRTTVAGNPIPSVILNNSQGAKIAWMANFTEGGRRNEISIGDDERLMLISLLMWASDKKSYNVLAPSMKVGASTTYIDAINKDMFEVYEFNLGIGYPF